MRTLTPRAAELLRDYPYYLHRDPFTRAACQAYANEFQRIEDAANAIRLAMFPTRTSEVLLLDGQYTGRFLSMWETLLHIPTAPAGVSEDARVQKAVAHYRKRHAASGLDWIANLNEALGGIAWAHQEGPPDYTITLTIPFASGSYEAGTVEALARDLTPAHEALAVVYQEGMLVERGRVGYEDVIA